MAESSSVMADWEKPAAAAPSSWSGQLLSALSGLVRGSRSSVNSRRRKLAIEALITSVMELSSLFVIGCFLFVSIGDWGVKLSTILLAKPLAFAHKCVPVGASFVVFSLLASVPINVRGSVAPTRRGFCRDFVADASKSVDLWPVCGPRLIGNRGYLHGEGWQRLAASGVSARDPQGWHPNAFKISI